MHSKFYRMVDGWRGIAAIAVVFFHIGAPHGIHFALVGVMMFFVISGYCIAASAERHYTGDRRGFVEFYKKRALRIYPPYLASLVFFVMTRLVKYAVTGIWQLSSDPFYWIQNVTLTQWLHLLVVPSQSPVFNDSLFVTVYWSLCYEEQFYVVIGLLMLAGALTSRANTGIFALLFVVSIAWIVATAPLFYGIFFDLWICFAFGVICYIRLCRTRTRSVIVMIDALLVMSFLLSGSILTMPGTFGMKAAPGVVQYIFVSAVFAYVLVLLRRVDDIVMDSPVGEPLRWLGLISYSLYLTHEFNLNASRSLAAHLAPVPGTEALVQIAILCAIATLFWYVFERPFTRGGVGFKSALTQWAGLFKSQRWRSQPPA